MLPKAILRPVAALAALAGLAAYAIIMLRGPQGLSALEEKRRQIRVLEEENADLQRDLDAKRNRIERLKSDTETQRVEITKRTGRIRSGDMEFKIPSQPSKAPAAR